MKKGSDSRQRDALLNAEQWHDAMILPQTSAQELPLPPRHAGDGDGARIGMHGEWRRVEWASDPKR